MRQAAEPSEAMNTMYPWYQYIALTRHQTPIDRQTLAISQNFAKGRWFTREGILQELITPSVVIFLDKRWWEMGTVQKLSPLADYIWPASILVGGEARTCPVSQKTVTGFKKRDSKDWRSCLLLSWIQTWKHFFGVNMLTLYREEGKAFIRLQGRNYEGLE